MSATVLPPEPLTPAAPARDVPTVVVRPLPPTPRSSALVIAIPERTATQHLMTALTSLAERLPELSAGPREVADRTRKRRRVEIAVVVVVLVILTIIWPLLMASIFCGVATVAYLGAVSYRVLSFRRALTDRSLVTILDEEALAYPAADLPRYTVLVPAYREPEVIAELVEHLEAIDYPREKLEVLVLLEEDDPETLAALQESMPPDWVRAIVVPPSEITTKPKACNYGLELATGDLLTIYDAEDRPDPLQLRKAAIAFSRLPAEVVCLQSKLGYFNAGQNLITGWFTAEYVTWFAHFLPGLSSLGAPIPLGGTSNHVRVPVLREVGAWDPYNVTEDADLGMRFARRGYRVEVLDSITMEEANSDFVNWIRQRSRWYKGYLQTWIVHMRHPRLVRQELGWRGLVGLNLFVGGTPILALLNPIFWGLALLYFAAHIHAIKLVFPAPVYYPSLVAFLFGNLAMIYLGLLSIREAKRFDLVIAALTVPLYWVMMSMAAVKALGQLIRNPSFWEKTQHGLATEEKKAA